MFIKKRSSFSMNLCWKGVKAAWGAGTWTPGLLQTSRPLSACPDLKFPVGLPRSCRPASGLCVSALVICLAPPWLTACFGVAFLDWPLPFPTEHSSAAYLRPHALKSHLPCLSPWVIGWRPLQPFRVRWKLELNWNEKCWCVFTKLSSL